MSGTQVQGREEAFPPTDGQKHSFLPWVLPSPGWSCSVQIRLGALSYSPSLSVHLPFSRPRCSVGSTARSLVLFSLSAARLPRLSGTAFLVVLHLASQQDTKPKPVFISLTRCRCRARLLSCIPVLYYPRRRPTDFCPLSHSLLCISSFSFLVCSALPLSPLSHPHSYLSPFVLFIPFISPLSLLSLPRSPVLN